MKKLLVYFLLFAISLVPLLAQQRKIDSLVKVIGRDKDDTQKVVHLYALGIVYKHMHDSAKTLEFSEKTLALSEKIGYKKGLAQGYMLKGWGHSMKNYPAVIIDNFIKAQHLYEELKDTLQLAKVTGYIGLYYMDIGNYQKAIEYYNKSLMFARRSGKKDDISATATDLGNVEINQGDYPDALKHYLLAFKMDEENGDSIGVCMDYDAIGNVYASLNDFPNSLHYHRMSMALALRVKDSNSYARAMENISDLYEEKKMHDSALYYGLKALPISKRTGDKGNIYSGMGNIGSIYAGLKNYPAALAYYDSALILATERTDKEAMAANMSDMGSVYTHLQQYDKAEKYLKEGAALADSIQSYQLLNDAYSALSNLYFETGKWQKAYQCLVKANSANDSLVSADKSKEIGKIEAKADYDKQLAVQQAEEEKKAAVASAESKKQKIIIGFSIAIVFIVALIALVIFRSLYITRRQKKLIETQKAEVENQKNAVEKQKDIVEHQKVLVEEKNKEILDSINYAKRLQDAIIPPASVIEEYFPESFVMYKPKDIVAGDFYWVATAPLNPPEGEIIFIAACDCTGHGVPGAMVSVVCSNALNRAVNEFGITEPGKILDKTRELVLETFEKSGGDIKDGMDISLLALTPNPLPKGEGNNNPSEGQRMRLQWAGAYNPLWYVENGVMKELNPDKQPIGKTDNPKPFTTHTINLSTLRGDKGRPTVLYLFTDGYPDQFGGPKGKKFKYQQLSEKLKMISEKPMKEQRQILEETFENWKGDMIQTDDVCFIGIRV